jgi:hypothetical protein
MVEGYRVKGKKSDKTMNGDNSSLVGKQTKKMTRGG